MIHPGLIGTAPSHELLAIWNKRERALVEEGEKARTLCAHLATRPLGESCHASIGCGCLCLCGTQRGWAPPGCMMGGSVASALLVLPLHGT